MPARVGSDWLVADRFSSLGAYGAVKRRKQRSPATIQGTCHGIYRAALEQEVRKMTRAPASSMFVAAGIVGTSTCHENGMVRIQQRLSGTESEARQVEWKGFANWMIAASQQADESQH